MASPTSGAPGAPILPDYAPVPRASLGPAVNDQGYYVGRIERNLYWVTDGDYHSAFLTTPDGVVLFDAPPSIGHNLQRAVNDIAAAEGGQGLPGRGRGDCRCTRHREVHRFAGRRGRVHGPHRLFDPGVDPPRPRLPHGRPPLSRHRPRQNTTTTGADAI